jgi:large subunit ribosomal protein L31
MKANIHPKLHAVKVHCSCGNEWLTMATVPELRLELCGACHPYFTGKKRTLDTAGRLQKFAQRYAVLGGEKAAAAGAEKGKAKAKEVRAAEVAKAAQEAKVKKEKAAKAKAKAAATTVKREPKEKDAAPEA